MKTLNTILLFLILWIPRILCVFVTGLVLFLGDFIPALLLIIFLILSWRWSWIGGIIFLFAEVAYLISKNHWDAMIYIPLFLIGVLFLLSWFYRKEIKEAQEEYYWGEANS